MCELGTLDRDILVRKFFQGMDNLEIAKQMGLDESSVAFRIEHAITLLKFFGDAEK